MQQCNSLDHEPLTPLKPLIQYPHPLSISVVRGPIASQYVDVTCRGSYSSRKGAMAAHCSFPPTGTRWPVTSAGMSLAKTALSSLSRL